MFIIKPFYFKRHFESLLSQKLIRILNIYHVNSYRAHFTGKQ